MTAVIDVPKATEPGRMLDDEQPRTLGFWDQTALWGNLGISLLGPIGAVSILATGVSLGAGLVATLVGTLIGTLLVALAAVAGARTGRPAMVLLRGLFGAKVSWVPTAVNVVQLLGWATFEIIVISQAASQLLPGLPLWLYKVLAGVLTTIMAIWPLGSVRMLRRVALVAVVIAMGYLFVQLGRHGLPASHGNWSGFWTSCDVVIAVAVSWVPLAADYTRHSRSEGAAFGGAMVGYTVTQVACYALGLLAFATVVSVSSADQQHDLFAAFLAVPLGWLAFGALVLRELDESFANVYSTAVSLQNLGPRVDRRVFAVVVGAVTTGFALLFNAGDYANFLYLLGSVFVPMFAVFAVQFFVRGGWRAWDTSDTAPARWSMLVPWALGFATYQLVNPGYVGWWAGAWGDVAGWLHFTAQSWMSASVLSFLVAALVTLAIPTPALRPAGAAPTQYFPEETA